MYKLGVDKAASPRWAKMMAAGKLSPAATEVLKKLQGLRPRQIGKKHLAEGAEKIVYKGFAGDDVGPAVIKRIKQELMPGTTKAYLNMASKHPEVFNAPIAVHEGGKGWTEKALQPLAPPRRNPDYALNLEDLKAIRKENFINSQERNDIISQFLSKSTKNQKPEQFVRTAPGELVGFGHNPSGEIGGTRVYDLHPGNIMKDEAGNPKLVDALVSSPRVKARRAIQKYGPAALSTAGIGAPAIAGAALADVESEVPFIDDSQMSESGKRLAKRSLVGAAGAAVGLPLVTSGIPKGLSNFLARKVAPHLSKGF